MSNYDKVIVVGLDGLEPKLVDAMLTAGELPNLERLRARGGYSRVRTTYPAQTPVAWSTFATGTNPGGHGIFDFIRRDPATYLPDLALNRYEQKNSFMPPKAVNLRRGTAVWDLLSDGGIPVTVLRCPCTYPPDQVRGRMLAGMGVPDVRGGLGTSSFYSTDASVQARESEVVFAVQPEADGRIRTRLIGPRNPKTGEDVFVDATLVVDRDAGRAVLHSEGSPRALELRVGAWSDWLRIKFKIGFLQGVSGMMRFFLRGVDPTFELYASPVNFDPDAPPFPISSPWEYAGELARAVGAYYTTGMVEDHTGLNNGRLDEQAYLAQCEMVLREREAMMLHELERFTHGFFFCLFDTPDRIQHMFWRFREAGHPANGDDMPSGMERVIEEHYRRCDEIVGRAMEYVDDRTLFIALSDHGFNSFQRGVHLNGWLHEQGLLVLRDGVDPGEEAGELLRRIDWSRTRAYALGLSGIYLNLQSRESQGCVAPSDAGALKASIIARLGGLLDAERGDVAIRSVMDRDAVYSGPYAQESPDLLVNYGSGYRASWTTGLGGVPAEIFEDNVKRWSGDHIVDPSLVPGVLFMNQPFDSKDAALADLAPTILSALGLPRGQAMEGHSLLGDV